jgi:hypothetical protein
MKKLLVVALLLLCGCAGRVAGTASWVPLAPQPPSQTPTQWDYQFPTGPLLGRVVLANGVYVAYGCNGYSATSDNLQTAQQGVITSCANANAQKKPLAQTLSKEAPMVINYAPCPVADIGKAYICVFKVTGGLPPYKWEIASGKLPPGLSLVTTFDTSTALIYGIPLSPPPPAVVKK